ncbi:tyrosinase-like [Rana temporaria]|uniref:tyrosinase-like n=1 Tax=Rana temporaria TaxID=8407 RepID=UPI001AADF7F9|nr:tyrosinase-like [Rana temporaria]
MIVFCVFLVLCYDLVQAQFPRACVTDEAIKGRTCCPVWKDKSTCGSSSGRGECFNRIVPQMEPVPQFNDDRLDWPTYYFDQACKCSENYSGYDCGECKYGYFGEKCDRKITIVRKEIRELSLLERKRFFSYLALAKITKSQDFVILYTGDRLHKNTYRFVDAAIYDVFAWIHYYSIKPILMWGTFNDTTNYAHKGPAFPGWHRLGLLFLERQIQLMTGDENFALPYWDWRGEGNKCSICNDDFVGGNDEQGFLSPYSYFAFWKSMCSGYNYIDSYCLGADDFNQLERLHRKPGTNPHAPSLPTFEDVEETLKWKDFDTPPYNRKAQKSFRNALEGFINPKDGITPQVTMHNLIHDFLGGTMGESTISSNDPIFVLHHCFLDKIYEEWLHRHNATSDVYPKNDQPGQGPKECATPYFPCYSNEHLLHRAEAFGYKYSTYKGM